jgi:hypothetical protein
VKVRVVRSDEARARAWGERSKTPLLFSLLTDARAQRRPDSETPRHALGAVAAPGHRSVRFEMGIKGLFAVSFLEKAEEEEVVSTRRLADARDLAMACVVP